MELQISEKKRLLITGIGGFTGHYLREEFFSQGWEVFGCGSRESALLGYFQVDLLRLETVHAMVADVQPHAVVHLAGIAFAAHRHPIDFYNTHVQGTLNLLDALAAKTSNLQKVLLASSANVYGNTTAGLFDETAPLKPFNDYGVSKLAMEYMAWLWREKLPIVIARPFNYTGVGQAAHFLLPKIIKHFRDKSPRIELGNLHVRRDYSDVRSVATAYRKLVECPEAKGAINVCSGNANSVHEVLEMASEISGHTLEVAVNPAFVRDNEVKTLYGDPAKLRSLIGHWETPPLQETLSWMLGEEAYARRG
jgi:GDP-6-deoxy-D-talose 4-dehydrogenase